MIAEGEMNTELVCVMASLGYHDEDDYYMGVDCIESLKDLVRFLRKEDDSCNIRRQMGASSLLQKDLLPMLMHLGDNEELTDIVVRLMVNLTLPVDMCFNKDQDVVEEENKKDKITNTFQTKKMEVVTHLQNYKKAFTREKALAAVGSQLGRILQMESEDRGQADLDLFERLLLLVRNVLHVPASPSEEQRTDDDASLHDQVLWNMHVNGIDELLVYISSSPEEARWTMHVMEIVFLMFREQNPNTLAKTTKEKSESEKAAIARDMVLAKEKEQAATKVTRKNVYSSRHSRFGGTFWVQGMKGIGQTNTLVQHRHVVDPKDISFDDKKHPRRVPKRLQPMKPMEQEKRSTLKIRLFLKEFCKKFLELSYNPIMHQVKDAVSKRAADSQENDDTYYIWSMRFFMEFNRAHSFKVEYVSETLNLTTFHYILKQLNTYYDQFLMNKRRGWEPWALRLHKALQTYKELLTYILNMDQANDNVLKDASAVIKNNIFYHEEYRNIFLVLLRHYVISRHTAQFLPDLIDTFHIFVKLLENFCKERGSLLVSKKQKVRKIKNRPRDGGGTALLGAMNAEQLEQIWEDDLAPVLSGLFQGYEAIPEIAYSPFDHLSDVPLDEQIVNALIKIQDFLRASDAAQAVALLRASRECWPDEVQLGAQVTSPEEEFGLARNILTMELQRPPFAEQPEEQEMEDDEDEEARTQSVEREFNLKAFLFSLASPTMMKPYCMQLKRFKQNTTYTNHAIVKMMHRVAVDMKFPEMFYQVSLLITFKEIMELELPMYKELDKFGRFIVYKFKENAITNPLIFVELLFWKSTGDCYQISSREPPQKAMTNKWTPEEESELKTLYDRFRMSDNVIAEILDHITDKSRTKRQIVNKLVAMQCVQSRQELPRADQHAENWTHEEEEELKTLFDQFKESDNVVRNIFANLSNPGNRTERKVINKLVRLRLIDRKSVPKVPKAPKDAWSVEQTAELHSLYEEHKNSDDILTNIMVNISFKKSKNAITKQLIETGKVADRIELRKTKLKKKKTFKGMIRDEGEVSENDEKREVDRVEEESRRRRNQILAQQSSGPIIDNWSDEEEEPRPKRPLKVNPPPKENRNMTERKFFSDDDSSDVTSGGDSDIEDNDSNNNNPTTISSLVEVARSEFPQQVVWLQTRLRRAANDRDEDEDWYAMPLLTMTEDDDLALHDNNFKKLLLTIGIRPPVDEQEMFWRIPETLAPATLRKYSNQLDGYTCMHNNTKDGDTSSTLQEEEDNTDSSVQVEPTSVSSMKTFENDGFIGVKKNAINSEFDDCDNDAITKNQSNIPTREIRAKRKRVLDDEDEESDFDISIPISTLIEGIEDFDDNNMIHDPPSTQKANGPTGKKRAKRLRILSDDDDESDIDDSIPIAELLEGRDDMEESVVDNLASTETNGAMDSSQLGILRDSTNINNINEIAIEKDRSASENFTVTIENQEMS